MFRAGYPTRDAPENYDGRQSFRLKIGSNLVHCSCMALCVSVLYVRLRFVWMLVRPHACKLWGFHAWSNKSNCSILMVFIAFNANVAFPYGMFSLRTFSFPALFPSEEIKKEIYLLACLQIAFTLIKLNSNNKRHFPSILLFFLGEKLTEKKKNVRWFFFSGNQWWFYVN